MINEIIKFIRSNLGQIFIFSIDVIGFLITIKTLQFVSTIRKKIKANKKKALCLISVKEIIGILRKNTGNWQNNPSDIDDRIIYTNEQIMRNISFIKKICMVIPLRKKLVEQKKYLHFLKVYDELVIDMEREEI